MNLIAMETRCRELFTEALSAKSEAIMEALRVSDDAKHSFTAKFNLKLSGHVVTVEGTLSHSTKDSVTFDGSFETEDPENPPLPGLEPGVTVIDVTPEVKQIDCGGSIAGDQQLDGP